MCHASFFFCGSAPLRNLFQRLVICSKNDILATSVSGRMRRRKCKRYEFFTRKNLDIFCSCDNSHSRLCPYSNSKIGNLEWIKIIVSLFAIILYSKCIRWFTLKIWSTFRNEWVVYSYIQNWHITVGNHFWLLVFFHIENTCD